MAIKKKKTSTGPKLFYIDYDEDINVMWAYGPMTYSKAVKAAQDLLQEVALDVGCCVGEIKILKEVAVVSPKSEKIEIIIKEVK